MSQHARKLRACRSPPHEPIDKPPQSVTFRGVGKFLDFCNHRLSFRRMNVNSGQDKANKMNVACILKISPRITIDINLYSYNAASLVARVWIPATKSSLPNRAINAENSPSNSPTELRLSRARICPRSTSSTFT